MDSQKSALLNILLEDSSSDESSSDEFEVQELFINILPCLTNERENIPKVTNFMGEVVSNYSDIEVSRWTAQIIYVFININLFQFKKNFRVDRKNCIKLSDDFEGSAFCPKATGRGGRPEFPKDQYVPLFLWWVHLFNIAMLIIIQ